MNDAYREFKVRLRRLDEVLVEQALTNVEWPAAPRPGANAGRPLAPL